MILNKKLSKRLMFFYLKTLCLFVGANILLTSLVIIVKEEIKNNFKSENSLNTRKLKSGKISNKIEIFTKNIF